MITKKVQGRIRRWYYREGLTVSEMARKSGYARNTGKNWLRPAEGTERTVDVGTATYLAWRSPRPA